MKIITYLCASIVAVTLAMIIWKVKLGKTNSHSPVVTAAVAPSDSDKILTAPPLPAPAKAMLEDILTFEGLLTGVVGENSGHFMKHLETKNGNYEVLTSASTVYKGLDVSERGVVWKVGKRYLIQGHLTSPPATEHLHAVQFINARVVELIEKSIQPAQ